MCFLSSLINFCSQERSTWSGICLDCGFHISCITLAWYFFTWFCLTKPIDQRCKVKNPYQLKGLRIFSINKLNTFLHLLILRFFTLFFVPIMLLFNNSPITGMKSILGHRIYIYKYIIFCRWSEFLTLLEC